MTTESDNLDPTKTSVRRLSIDIQMAITDEEDIIRNAIYEKLKAEISNDEDDCDEGPPPEICDFLKLINDPLCMNIGKVYATCGDMWTYSEIAKFGRTARIIGDETNRSYFWFFILLDIGDRPVSCRYLLNIAKRALETEMSYRYFRGYLNVVSIVAMNHVGFYERMVMNMLLQYAERFRRSIRLNSISNTRQKQRINNSQRQPTKYVDIAVTVIAMVGTACYFFWI